MQRYNWSTTFKPTEVRTTGPAGVVTTRPVTEATTGPSGVVTTGPAGVVTTGAPTSGETPGPGPMVGTTTIGRLPTTTGIPPAATTKGPTCKVENLVDKPYARLETEPKTPGGKDIFPVDLSPTEDKPEPSITLTSPKPKTLMEIEVTTTNVQSVSITVTDKEGNEVIKKEDEPVPSDVSIFFYVERHSIILARITMLRSFDFVGKSRRE